MQDLKKLIEDAWDDRKLLQHTDYINAIDTVIERLDKGELRVAKPVEKVEDERLIAERLRSLDR